MDQTTLEWIKRNVTASNIDDPKTFVEFQEATGVYTDYIPTNALWTMLYYTVDCNDYESTSYLLDMDAKTNIRTRHGNMPLHSACENGRTRIIKLL
jgi:ankyrin repeat protein